MRSGHDENLDGKYPGDSGATTEKSGDNGRIVNILLIDDDERFLNRFTKYLSPRYKVTAVKGWREGKELFYSRTPDVVLLDYKLGDGYDGLDVLREIRNNGYSYLVVIIVSAHLDDSVIEEARRIGADQCISKHTSDEELTG